MSTYPLPDLLHKWSIGEVTVEQVLGHLLQNCLKLLQQQTEQEKRLRQLEQLLKP